MGHKIQEFMRGSEIEYQQKNQLQPGYLKYFRDKVWGTDSDEDGRDIVSIGNIGCRGYLYVEDIIGIEITETMVKDYGFLRIENISDCITYFRDDFGYIKLDTYGIEHVYMKGKPIRYLHDFQRIFYDYKGYILYPKKSDMPRKEFKSALVVEKKLTADEMLQKIENLNNLTGEVTKIDLAFKF